LFFRVWRVGGVRTQPDSGRGRGATADVRHPAADRPTARAACAGMRGAAIRNGPTTAGGVRLDEWKASSFSAVAPAIGTFCRLPRRSCSNFLAGQTTMPNHDLDYPTTGFGIWGMSTKAARSAASPPPNGWFERCRACAAGFPVVEDAQKSDSGLTITGDPGKVG
jgi:hypothetical protein